MIKVSDAVFHPDASAVSGRDLSERVAQMRQSLCQIQESSNLKCESTSDNLGGQFASPLAARIPTDRSY
ncbi:hypothetical protein SAMN05720354_13117 [Nitrosospira sp. Nsp1]|nr:hypothetical protein SAMN05720354_13117 [Nitrosospira sp. Nsp1]